MIFSIPGHIEMIRRGLHYVVLRPHYPKLIIKTQTRRVTRGSYKIGNDYAVTEKWGAKAEADIRIVIDNIWKEQRKGIYISAPNIKISYHDAEAEGGYDPLQYELEFRKLYPNWDGEKRWAYAFHAIEVHK